MDGLEADIAIYLTVDGQVFIVPQYDIKREMNEGRACPDFVALDFSCKEVVVVEVTGAADWKPLAGRVRERHSRWFNPVRKRLMDQEVITPSWNIRFLGFIRRDAVKGISKQFDEETDVTFFPVEDATILWRFWEKRMKDGLPGNRRNALSSSI